MSLDRPSADAEPGSSPGGPAARSLQAHPRPAGLAGGAVAAVALAVLVVAAVLSPAAIRFAPR